MVSRAYVQPDLSDKQTEQHGKKYISRKNWRACEKLTPNTLLRENRLLIWVSRFPYQGMEHLLEWELPQRTANTMETILDGWAHENVCLVLEQ